MNNDNIYVHTPCKATIISSNYNSGDSSAYIMEYFSKNLFYYDQFIKNLIIVSTCTSQRNEIPIDTKKYSNVGFNVKYFYAFGQNNILLMYKKSVNNNPITSIFLNLNKAFIDKIINVNTISDSYAQFHFFPNIDNPEILYISDNIIISLDVHKYLSEMLAHDIINKKKNGISSIEIKDYIFNVTIRCDNVIILGNRYKNNMDKLKSNMLKSHYRSVFYLEKSDLTKLKTVKREIIDFYSKYNISEEMINMDVILYHYYYGNEWMEIIISVSDVFNGEYRYQRLTMSHKTIPLDDLIDIMETMKNNKLHELIDNKYQ